MGVHRGPVIAWIVAAAVAAGCRSSPPVTIATTQPTSTTGVWQELKDFPPAGAVLLDLASDEQGFVIGGSTEAPTDACRDQRDARIWSSNNGRTWTERSIDRASNASVTALATQLAVGQTGCDQEEPVAWRSARLNWMNLLIDGLSPGAEIADLVGAETGPFVASGRSAENEPAMGIWTVAFGGKAGVDWQPATDAPPSVRDSTLTSLAANSHTIVGFDITRDPYAWYSPDGATWIDSDLRPAYGLLTTGSTHNAGDFFAAGRGCCGLPDQRFGAIVRSGDGQSWTQVRLQHFASPIEGIVATGSGLLAVGTATYLSADGSDWRLGPPLPGYVDEIAVINRVPVPYRLKLAVVADTVVVIGPTDVWVASLNSLAAAKWPDAAPAAVMPVVGQSYEATLQTHCGPFNGPLYFDARSWIPDLPGGSFPLRFDYYYETGTLAYVARDRLEFTGSAGDVVAYLPTDDPPHGAPCH